MRYIRLALEEHVYQRLYELEDGHWWFRGRRAVLWALIARGGTEARAPRILDAGCGTGRNLVEFSVLGPAQGIDPSSEAVAFCRRRGLEGVTEAGLEALPFADDAFDLLLACDVLEHVERDDDALRELLRVAAPGARLVITVPAYRWLRSAHDESHHHFRRYTLGGLRDRVAGAGWRPVVSTYFNSVLLPPIAAVRTLSRALGGDENGTSDYDRAPAGLNRVLEQPMRAEARAIRRGARLPAGVSVGMVSTPA